MEGRTVMFLAVASIGFLLVGYAIGNNVGTHAGYWQGLLDGRRASPSISAQR